MSISTINVDIDDNGSPIRADYRYPYTFEETTSSSLPKFNTRSCLITLFLILAVVALLSLAGLIIAIYALTSNARSSGIVVVTFPTASTTTVNNSVTTTPLQCSSSPKTSYVYATDTPPQCINYTLNIDETRNIAYTRSINNCDNTSPFLNTTTSVWIRFQDPAGTLLANSPVPPNSCGTVATGWYAGQYPTAFFSTATSIVCYYYSTNTCSACNLISVTNCQTFYVYQLLQPPSCNYRYCTL